MEKNLQRINSIKLYQSASRQQFICWSSQTGYDKFYQESFINFQDFGSSYARKGQQIDTTINE